MEAILYRGTPVYLNQRADLNTDEFDIIAPLKYLNHKDLLLTSEKIIYSSTNIYGWVNIYN